MRIKSGNAAKEFNLKDIFDNQIKLSDYKGTKLMISFYRYASCPLCNLRIHELIQNYESLNKQGLYMIAFFQSPRESILKYVGKQDSPFPIIADPKRLTYKDYGVESSWELFLKGMWLRRTNMMKAMKLGFTPGTMEGDKALIPADFLIGEDSIVRKTYYGKDIGDHLPLDEIEEWLKNGSQR